MNKYYIISSKNQFKEPLYLECYYDSDELVYCLMELFYLGYSFDDLLIMEMNEKQ